MSTVDLIGQPVPQGSMKCVGRNGFHSIQPDNRRALVPWRRLVVKAGEALALRGGGKLTGPVAVEITVTFARPATVKPVERRWPWKKSTGHGDADKIARSVLDGLTGPLLADDAQVCELHVRKVYPDTFDVLDAEAGPYPWTTCALPSPGASIAVRSLT